MADTETLSRSWRAWLSSDDRLAGPWWAPTVWTLLFATACAVLFTVVSIAVNTQGSGVATMPRWWGWFESNLVMSLTISIAIRLLFVLGGRVVGRDRLRDWGRTRRTVYFTALPLLGVAIGWPLGMWWAWGVDVRGLFSVDRPGTIVGTVVLAVVITTLFQMFFAMKAREIQAENRATEAQLRLLQAQIEPHFLFNTLANVVSLVEEDPPRARAMLESFVDYLRASLVGLGHAGHTLGDEIDLIDAYLRIVAMRMEDRLAYAIDVPADLRKRPLPALLLQPLVENAVLHGLEPQIDGGRLSIAARIEGSSLVLVVTDDGAGMANVASPTPGRRAGGSGTALANIRARLRQAHGSAASLQLGTGPSGGVAATLRLPAGRPIETARPCPAP